MKNIQLPGTVVTTNWLFEHLDNPDLVILDGTMLAVGASSENIEGIPGALFFDIRNRFSAQESNYPNTQPTPESFAIEVAKLGITNQSIVVVYDQKGIYSSARVWWLFKAMGHEAIAVLDGGFPAWLDQGYKTAVLGNSVFHKSVFYTTYKPSSFVTTAQVLKGLSEPLQLILDARSPGRFKGTLPEPRDGMRSGHIPTAKNVPFSELLNEGSLKSNKELEAIFDEYETTDKQLVFSCGSGITACILALAATQIGLKNLTIYDGSWSEWGSRSELPIEIG